MKDKRDEKRVAELREVLSGAALTDKLAQFLQSQSQILARDFEQFGLDPNNSAHRTMLLVVLADFVFGRRKRGRPPGKKQRHEWHAAKLHLLGFHYEEAIANNPDMSYPKAAAAIKKRNIPEFKHDTAMTIRQRIPGAKRQLAQARAFLKPEKSVTATPAHIEPSGGIRGSFPKM